MAVGDIDSVKKSAKLKREAMQVELHARMERKMPKRILKQLSEMEHTVNYAVDEQILLEVTCFSIIFWISNFGEGFILIIKYILCFSFKEQEPENAQDHEGSRDSQFDAHRIDVAKEKVTETKIIFNSFNNKNLFSIIFFAPKM